MTDEITDMTLDPATQAAVEAQQGQADLSALTKRLDALETRNKELIETNVKLHGALMSLKGQQAAAPAAVPAAQPAPQPEAGRPGDVSDLYFEQFIKSITRK